MTRLSDPQGAAMYDQRDERGQRQRDADQDAYEARTEGRALSLQTLRRLRDMAEAQKERVA